MKPEGLQHGLTVAKSVLVGIPNLDSGTSIVVQTTAFRLVKTAQIIPVETLRQPLVPLRLECPIPVSERLTGCEGAVDHAPFRVPRLKDKGTGIHSQLSHSPDNLHMKLWIRYPKLQPNTRTSPWPINTAISI